MNSHRSKRPALWMVPAAVALCCAFPSAAQADDDIDIVCPCTVEFSNLTSVSFRFGIRNLQTSAATGPLQAQLIAREPGETWGPLVATIDLSSVPANSTRSVREYTAAFRRPQEQGRYELTLEIRSASEGRRVESVTWLTDAVELSAGGTANSSVYFDGTPTIELGDGSATVKLPVMKNGAGGTQADGLKLELGTNSSLTDYPRRIGEHDLGRDLSPGSQSGASTINMSFEADRLRDYVSVLIVNSDNRTLLQEVVSVPDGEQLPKREFATEDASLLVDSDGDGVGDANERLEGTDPDDAESTPPETTLDVLGMYLPSVAELYGGDPTTRLRHVVNLASIIFQDSGTGVKLRLVGMLAVEEEDFDDADFVDELSRKYGADMGLLFWPSARFCGWAPLGGKNANGKVSFRSVPLANVMAPCGAGTTAHEIGHVMGLGHSVIQRNNAPTGTYRWARGHGVFQIFGTTMTYESLYGGAPVLDLFSDPDRDCKGLPCGSATDQKDAADAVAALRTTRFQIANIGEAKPDTDNDGVVDPADAFPGDPDEHSDFDGDGIGDKADTDDDGDGIADADDLFPLDSLEWVDADSDGVGDNADAFPDDPGEAHDTDGDGVGDNADLFPEDPMESVDTDNDGIGNNGDAFPFDTREWLDTDGDGVGDNADKDADNDGVVDTHDVFPLDAARSNASSYRIQLEDGANQSLSLSSAGDVDGDGREDFLIGAVNYDYAQHQWSSAAYLIAAADLEAADAADGAVDRVLEIERLVSRPGSWKLTGEYGAYRVGYSVAMAGDMDGDGLPELLIGAPDESGPRSLRSSGAAYLVSPADLSAADAADGAADGVVALANIPAQANSWKILGEGEEERAGASVGPLGDINGDNVPDLAIGAPGSLWLEDPHSGRAYLISGQGLKDADIADGDGDGIIDLAQIASQAGSWKLAGELAGDRVGDTVPGTYVDENGAGRLIMHAPGSYDSTRTTGAVYLIALDELSAADAADGEADGVVDLGQAGLQPGSWQLVGSDGNRAEHGATIGDHDSDGIVDVIVRVSKATYFVSGADLGVADESDGIRDRAIVLTADMEAPNSWSIAAGYSTASKGGISSGRMDGDELEDLILHDSWAGSWGGAALLSGRALAQHEGAGRVQLEEFLEDAGAWELRSFSEQLKAIAMAGDVDSDGNDDMLLGSDGWVYLINSTDLDALDSADDNKNGIIDLGQTTGDTDQDGIDDITDPDDDNDGFPDFEDSFPRDAGEWADSDGDGVGDNADVFPDDWNRRFDTDADGIADRQDTDDDGDGIADGDDEYPLDTDNDAIDNQMDPDDDNDGVPDSDDAFPLDSEESSDFDSDGIGDNADTDDDNDGVADSNDALPFNAAESEDQDGDGAGDNADVFPQDPEESLDTDGDGIGDNADTDDDNDGTADASDAFPLDAAETADSDSDGIGDNSDAFPQDSSEWTDTDSDGIGDNADTDDDGDGYTDRADSYPLDAGRQRLFMFRLSGRYMDSLFGNAVAGAGDVDSDGRSDLLVGAPIGWSGSEGGRAQVVTGAQLEAGDRADGMRDGLVSLGDITAQSGHWALVGKRHDDRLGYDLLAVGDIGGDGKQDWLLGASGRNNTTAAAYLVSPSDLVDLYPDGSRDGATNIAEILSAANAWELTAEGQGHDYYSGTKVALIDDADGDGKPEFLLGTSRHSEDHDPGAAVPGAAYLVSSAHLTRANASGAHDDSRIDLAALRDKSGVWKFLGESDGDRAGAGVASAGDIDGDGLTDMAIGAYGHTASLNHQGAVYLIAAADLLPADRADGQEDRVIRLANISTQPSSWKLVGEHENGVAGYSVGRGDINGDGQAELVITAAGVRGSPAAVYVLPLSELSAADAADGAGNGVINLSHVASLDNGWKLEGDEGSSSSAIVGEYIAAPRVTAADVNGDGIDELIVGILLESRYYWESNSWESNSTAYVISGADLAAADGADGQFNGEILLDNVIAGEESWKFAASGFVTGIAAPGDISGDDIGDLVFGKMEDSYGSVFIASGAELALADLQDGEADRVIDLEALPNWYRSIDFDLDGIEDAIDSDDDNDGVFDTRDAFPHDPAESHDNDHDGIGNNADPDDDNDGTEDAADVFPFNPYETIDSDGDGVGNNADSDDDNDGVSDEEDAFPLDFYESVDSDGDGLGDNIDPDDDNDGVPDGEDDTPRGTTGSVEGGPGGIAGAQGRGQANDGVADGGRFFYRLRGEARALAGSDFDGDGLADLIIGSAADPRAAYLVSGADLGDADQADGAADRFVDMDRVSALRNSWKITHIEGARRLFFAGDVDSDTRDDVLVSGGDDTYIVPMSSMNAADSADASTDRAVTVGRGLVGSALGVWRLLGPALEPGVYSLADVNGDGHDELLIGAPWTSAPAEFNAAYVASGSGWAAADGLDGSEDDLIDLNRLAGQPWSFKVVARGGSGSGASIASGGDVDGDGYADLLVSAPGNSAGGSPGAPVVSLLSGSSMASLDGRDGVRDGVIRLHQAQGAGLWRFTGESLDAERLLPGAGDVDGDGLSDLLLSGRDGVFLIAGGGIRGADAADGVADRSIDIANAAAQPGSYRFTSGMSAGSGLSVLGVGDFDDDSHHDILIIRNGSSTAHLIAAKDFGKLDTAGGWIDVADLPPLPNSWVLRIAAIDTLFDGAASYADLNGDGRPELIINACASDNVSSRSAYVISTAELAAADALDGATDRTLTLDALANH